MSLVNTNRHKYEQRKLNSKAVQWLRIEFEKRNSFELLLIFYYLSNSVTNIFALHSVKNALSATTLKTNIRRK